MSISENLGLVRKRIDEAARRAGRSADEVTLVAVSKMQPVEEIRRAYEAGQRVFGENYAQELRDKVDQLADLTDIKWHYIGRLQRNKAKYIAPVASMIESVDSLELAQELDKRAAAAGRALPALIEVNLGEEQKGGVPIGRLDDLLAKLSRCSALHVEGLMCIPPVAETPEASRPLFARMRELSRERGFHVLSMGMSADFEVAVEEGATLVRVGTAIFGARPRRNLG